MSDVALIGVLVTAALGALASVVVALLNHRSSGRSTKASESAAVYVAQDRIIAALQVENDRMTRERLGLRTENEALYKRLYEVIADMNTMRLFIQSEVANVAEHDPQAAQYLVERMRAPMPGDRRAYER